MISRIITLTRVLLKTSRDQIMKSGLSQRKKKKNKRMSSVGRKVLFGILYLYIFGIVGFFSYQLIAALNAVGQPGLAIQMLFIGVSVYLLLMGIIFTPTVFYFSKDIERLLVMPIRPLEIVSAKLLTTFVLMVEQMAMFTIPFGIAYFVVVNPGWSFIPFYILANLFLPLLPVALSVGIIIILFTFIPFFKNKDVFTYISMFIGFAMVFFFIFAIQIADPESSFNIEQMLLSLQSGDNALINLLSGIFPSSDFLARGIVNTSLLSIIIGIVISIVSTIAIIFLTQFMYFKGAIGISEGTAKKRKMSHSETYSESISKSQRRAILEYDFKNILRTPTYMMNYFLIVLIMPLFMFLPILLSGGLVEIMGGLPMVADFFKQVDSMQLLMIFFIGGFLIAFFMSAMGTISSTAFSREGRSMLSFSVMPIPFETLLQAKILLGTLTMVIVPLLIGVVGLIIVRVPVLSFIGYMIAAVLATVCENTIAMVTDVYAPKLNWENEQQAVKNNFMAVVPMFVMMGLSIISVFIILNTELIISAPLITVMIVVFAFVCYKWMIRLGRIHFPKKLEEL
ncbi:hypothetical protein [Erysipelothrix anatis]|uniref:hypothetical protein n=1 Tax=Erysipelothrix anatis TaxID=2683713 RepID=UPI00135AFA74|nr:hypothetical protein [Erysipelothrix anatis]